MQHMKFLKYVDEIAKAGSIRKAAENLNIVSSAVNRRILDLEQELGENLFERLPRGVRLTPAGEVFLNYARKQISEIERMKSDIDSLSGLKRGEIKLAVIEAASGSFLPHLIANFNKQYPQIAFKISVCGRSEVVEKVLNFEADIGLVLNPPPNPKFRPLIILEQKVKALMAIDHPLAKKKSVKLLDCLNYPISLPDSVLGTRALLDSFLGSSSLKVKPVLESNSFEMMRKFSRLSGGICFQVDIGALQKEPVVFAENEMIALPIEESKLPSGALVLGMHQDRVLPLAAAKFAQEMEMVLSKIES